MRPGEKREEDGMADTARTFGRRDGRGSPSPPAVRAVADALAEGGLLWLAGRSALFLAVLVGIALLL